MMLLGKVFFTLLFLVLEVSSTLARTRRSVEENWLTAQPFQRFLQLETPLMEGKDVGILQNLLRRYKFAASALKATGSFDAATHLSLKAFQKDYHLTRQDGTMDPETGRKVIEELISDGYSLVDIPHNCKFFIRAPVRKDRTVELNATLHKCGPDTQLLYTFPIRASGGTSKGVKLNQLTCNGNTPTGLSTVDLNTKFQPNWKYKRSYGAYPIFRLIKGIKGNVAIGRVGVKGNDNTDESFLNDYRRGLLVHSFVRKEWDPSMPMADGFGCMKVHPKDLKNIVDIVKHQLGVVVRNNTWGRLPYPHQPQGLISVEQID